MHHLYRTFFIIGTVLLLVNCSSNTQESQSLEFVVTPEADGHPAFMDTDSGYPVQSDNSIGYPNQPPSSANDSGYPAPISTHSNNGRTQTVIESYELANSVALNEFHSNAYLAAIIPSHIMLINLGNPPVVPGWFFKFRKPDSRREFIVQVVDDIISGTTLTESAMDAGYVENPIDIPQLTLDSTDVLVQFQEIGTERGIWSEVLAYDLELVNLEGSEGPVWSVVDPLTQEWLFSIDAITGEEVSKPYQ